ncbi:hypothetical protein [Burkholderia sp. PAMC 28687]|uniref:hypothetical protein n=1 Tax=Burkholderia sp. PAMC 28687 TaxID=1795874 RepID=UPI000A7F6BF4|nr:hypothetical protein [Burkholderia sp. PAMC 28687]
MNVTDKKSVQMTLDFEPGLTDRYTSLRDCVATAVYQRGLSKCAIDLNESPGNLSNKLSENPNRHFNIDDLERFLTASGDMTPLYYLTEKFLRQRSDAKKAATEKIQQLGPQLIDLLRQAGISA